MRKFSSWPVLLLALLPLVVLYPLAIVGLSESGLTGTNLAYSLTSMLWASALAAVGWLVAGWMPWGKWNGLWLYGLHLGGAIIYAVVWWLGTAVLRTAMRGGNINQSIRDAVTGPFLFWNILLGVLIYGVCIGLFYAARSQEEVRDQRLQTARAEAVAARAQLTALQARLNPHFLFNALHSLSTLIETDQRLAEEAVDRLGTLFRYSLEQSGRETVTLRQEWSFVEDYLAIEQLRFGDRMTVKTHIEPRTLDVHVPPFCLQPLVENAIRHGIAPLEGPGTVTIVASMEEGSLRLDIIDDGVGADKATMDSGQGFGLQALRRYVEHNAAGGGRLTVESRPGSGCRASVLLPVGRSKQ